MMSKNVKWTILVLIAVFIAPDLYSQIQVPPLSPKSTLVQKVGFTDITITYSRPSLRGRVIFGELVPFNQMWRTGANEATVVSFSDPVTINGISVPRGYYSLFTIPGEDEWEVILNDNIFLFGLRGYKESEDYLRLKVKPDFLSYHVETFTIDIGEITQTTATLMLSWENTMIKLKVGTNADTRIINEIESALDNPMGKMANTYYSSAAYYLENHKDLDKALEWIDKAIEINGEESTYVFLKARIYGEFDDYGKSIDLAKKAKKLALASKNDSFAGIIEKHISKWEKM